jgi:hypothetical protein
VKGERPGLRLAWRDWHRRDARPCYRRAGLLGGARPRRGRAMVRSRHHRPCAGAALARRQSDERAQGGLRRLRAVAPAGLSVAVASGVSEVRIGLAAGGRWIRTCMGLFLSSAVLGCADSFLFGAGKAVFRPVACDPVRGARGRGQGTETVAKLSGLPPSVACVSQRLEA